jgi:hypothetical protein
VSGESNTLSKPLLQKPNSLKNSFSETKDGCHISPLLFGEMWGEAVGRPLQEIKRIRLKKILSQAKPNLSLKTHRKHLPSHQTLKLRVLRNITSHQRTHHIHLQLMIPSIFKPSLRQNISNPAATQSLWHLGMQQCDPPRTIRLELEVSRFPILFQLKPAFHNTMLFTHVPSPIPDLHFPRRKRWITPDKWFAGKAPESEVTCNTAEVFLSLT